MVGWSSTERWVKPEAVTSRTVVYLSIQVLTKQRTRRTLMTDHTSRNIPWLLLIAVAGMLIALLIDVLDGQTIKTMGTLALLLGLVGLTAQRMTQRAVFTYVAVAGIGAFVCITAYRAAVYQGWL